jgi:hypothetical protein
MSLIYIHLDKVRSVRLNALGHSSRLMNARLGISGTGSGIDSQIKARRGIEARLSKVNRSLEKTDRWLKEWAAFLENSPLLYNRNEDRLVREAESVKSPWKETPWWQAYFADPLDEGLKYAGLGADLFKIYSEYKGMKIQFYKENGKMMVKVIKGDWTYNELKSLLTDRLGMVSDWNKALTKRLNNRGVSLYDYTTDRFNTRYSDLFGNTNIEGLNDYVNNLGKSKWTVFGSTFTDAWFDDAKVWNDYTGWAGATKLDKAMKGMGIAGDILTVAGNFTDNFYNPRTGELEYSGEAMKTFVVDTVVDVGTSAAAIATGAAVGSLIAPPLGTVVGAGVGFGVDMAMNYEFGGPPPKSLVDHTKDAANAAVDWTVDAAGEVWDGVENVANDIGNRARNELNYIGNKLSSVFW